MKRIIMATAAILVASSANAGMYFPASQLQSVGKNDQQEVFALRDTKLRKDNGITEFDALHKYTEQGKKEVFPDKKKPNRPDFVVASYEAKCEAGTARMVYAKTFANGKDLGEGKLPKSKFQKFPEGSVLAELINTACSPDFE